MGRPVVATNHGGAMETILDGVTGWLVPPNDSDAMAKAIGDALSMDEHSHYEMATRAMAHVADNFTKTNMVEQTLDVYAELLKTKYLEKAA